MKKIKSLVNSFRYSATFWLAIAVTICGLWAFSEQYFIESNELESTEDSGGEVYQHSLDEILYKTIQLFILQTGVEPKFNSIALVLARIFAAAFFLSTIFSVLTKVFQESYDSLRLQFLNGHTIVCGLGKTGLQIVEEILDEQVANRKWYQISAWTLPRVVVIESNSSKAAIGRVRSKGGLVVIGDATNVELLETIGVLNASRLVIATGSDEANAEVVFDCANIMRTNQTDRRQQQKLDCLVKIRDPTVFQLFNTRANQYIPNLPINLRVFNPAATCARRMIENEAIDWRPTTTDEVGLFVLIGFGEVGQSIALQIAELAHFENRKRQRILVVDEGIKDIASRFTAQFGTFTHVEPVCSTCREVSFKSEADNWHSRALRPFEDECVDAPGVEYVCNTKFVEAPKHYSERSFTNELQALLAEENVKPVVLVCRDQDRENFDIAGLLADTLHRRLDKFLPIYAWLPRQKALWSVLESTELPSDANYFIKPFGSTQSISLRSLIDSEVEKNAERLHKDYQKKYCKDKSGACADWDQLSETFRQSNRSAAIHASMKQRVLESQGIDSASDSISDEMADVLAEMEHNRWMSERLLSGWQYGPEKDQANLRRPSIQPWNNLPTAEREKDRSQVKEVVKIVKRKAVIESTKDKFKRWKTPSTLFGERRVKNKKIAVAIVRDDDGKFLLIHNEDWGGFNFPMMELDENRPPLGSKAISALESEVGARLQKATARELEYLGRYGISDRTGEDAIYEYWLYEVDPGEPLPEGDGPERKKLSLEEIVGLPNGTWSTKAIADELLNNREVAVAIVSRLGKVETEYLVIRNENYGGYFFPSMRRKTELSPETVAEKLYRDDFGYTGEIESTWQAEVEDVHFSQRFQAETQFRFHICEVAFPELDIHMPFNALERRLSDRGIEWKWVTADELGSTEEYSPTINAIQNQVFSSMPAETRIEPLPISEGGIALITRDVNGETEFLAQWNDKWKAFFFIGGHREEGESFRECVIRETCEELELSEGDFQVSAEPVRQLEYLAVSKRTNNLTTYRSSVFEVEVVAYSPADSETVWLTAKEIENFAANDGREVSKTIYAVLSFV